MKFVQYFFASGIIMLALLSCGKTDDCADLCDPVYPSVKFFIKNSGGQNLVCGPDLIYTIDQIKVKSQVSGVLTDSQVYIDGGDTTNAATGLVFSARLGAQYYLYINGLLTDSMQINYQTNNPSRKACCPNYNSITSLKLNTVATSYVFPDNTSSVIVTK